MLFEAASARRADAVGAVPEAGFPPVYSDLGYLLVGEALARVTGEPLDVTLEREVLGPLRLDIGSARRLSARDANFTRDVAATEVVPGAEGLSEGPCTTRTLGLSQVRERPVTRGSSVPPRRSSVLEKCWSTCTVDAQIGF